MQQLPGTPEHQRLLRAITSYYKDDPRVRALSVFGSLGSGTWDEFSDLDLDAVIRDGVVIDPIVEMSRLCRALGEQPVVVRPDNNDAADVLLPSLIQFSIRYHSLGTTSPNIVDSLQVLTSRLGKAAIQEAGRANEKEAMPVGEILGSCIRLLVELDGRLHRRQFWTAYQLLHLARERLLQIFATARKLPRPYHAFQANADEVLKDRVLKTVPHDNLLSLQAALLGLLKLLEHDLEAISLSQIRLTEAERNVLATLRRRQLDLDLG